MSGVICETIGDIIALGEHTANKALEVKKQPVDPKLSKHLVAALEASRKKADS